MDSFLHQDCSLEKVRQFKTRIVYFERHNCDTDLIIITVIIIIIGGAGTKF